MNVYDAVASRRAVRCFLDKPVPKDVLSRVFGAAARAPSGANLQPWHTYVLTGVSLAELKNRVAMRLNSGDAGDEEEFAMYPARLKPLYRARQSAAAAQRYAALGISRDDAQARKQAVAANWDSFGAPVTLFCYIDRDMGLPQWADLGMYLQTVMLLLRAEGLHSCPQLAWTVYHRTVADVLSPPNDLLLFCGMAIGFEDTSAMPIRTDRAPLSETVIFLD